MVSNSLPYLVAPIVRCRRAASALLLATLACAAVSAPAPGGAHASPPEVASGAFEGQDPFDIVRTVDELRDLQREVVEVISRVRPSVVLIQTTGRRTSSGTAVIISPDGLLATCGHVGRAPGREVTATLADGTTLRGTTLGQVFDSVADCGLVQLDTEGRVLPSVPLGSSDDLAEGDWLVALGYTHGLRGAARPSLARVGRVLGVEPHGLFMDAPIDAGDSGGPSFNLRGEVVGLNSRCGPESWQNVATPIDRLVERLDALKGDVEAAEEDEGRGRQRRAPRVQYPITAPDIGKAAVERDAALESATRRAEASLVRVSAGGAHIANGIVIDPTGLVVTKASQLDPEARVTIETAARSRHVAVEVARDTEADVALLRFEPARPGRGARDARPRPDRAGADSASLSTRRESARPSARAAPRAAPTGRSAPRARVAPDGSVKGGSVAAVTWATDEPIVPGEVVLTPRGFGGPAILGFASIESRESEADDFDGPYLGVQTRASTDEELAQAEADRAVTVVRVMPESAAERAGLAQGDLILAVNDDEVGDPSQLRRLLRRHRPGDAVGLTIVGAEGLEAREATLGRRGDSVSGVRRGNTSTPISRRSSGLGSLLAHDGVTRPEDMGGPIVDADGHVIGMNIARYDRTATHAIGAARMAEIVARLVELAGR